MLAPQDRNLGTSLMSAGIGAALSTTLADLVVVRAGYGAAFLTLTAVAASGFLVFLFAMPETKAQDETMRPTHAHEPSDEAPLAAAPQVAAR